MTSGLKFVLAPMGSAGDVHPFVWLGRLLRRRGHEVVVVAQSFVAEMAEREGFRVVKTGDAAQQEAIIHHPDLWHPRKAFPMLMGFIGQWGKEMLPALEAEVGRGAETVMLAGALAFMPRVYSERWEVPLLTVHLQPSVMLSVEEMPVMKAGMEWVTRSPRWVRRAFAGMVQGLVDRVMSRPIGRLREAVGLAGPAPRGIMREWWHSPDGVICLFPEWYAPVQPDWPSQVITTRFPLYDEGAVTRPIPELEAFLAAGEAPVVITPGSANAQASTFLREAAEGCRSDGRRAVLVTRYPGQVPPGLPETMKAFEYVPFSWIFPRAAAVVHHGGIGTTAQCFAAGVPQLIMPMSHDQPDNAARAKRFGVAESLYPKAFRAKAIAGALRRLTTSPSVAISCGLMRQRMARQMSEGAMGELLENAAERAIRVRKINGAGVAN